MNSRSIFSTIRTVNSIWIIVILAGTFACKNEPISIQNPSMELVQDGEPLGWESSGRRNQAANYSLSEVAYHGERSISISSDSPSRGMWSTNILLSPLTKYRFTAWIKTEDIVAEDGEGVALILNGMKYEPEYLKGTHDWRQVVYEFESGWDDSMQARLTYGAGGRATGQVWLDHLSLEVISDDKPEPAVRADLSQLADMPMEKYIYGQFIEHLGNCIYGGIWAEMFEDRKFYYSPGDSISPWDVHGDQARLEMDTLSPYVGMHTPVIMPGKSGGGISQDNIGLRKGIACEGRIILRAGSGIDNIVLKLYWDDDSYDSTVVSGITQDYTTFDYVLTPQETTLTGRLEVTGKGEGHFAIGTLSLMPEDNIDGFREDVLSLLKELNSPVYRWPGGNFVSGYDWKDGIGPVDRRPPRKNPAWRGVEHNDVGIHEFNRLCELLNTEPYIAVNAGLGGSEGAREQVEYVNGSSDTPKGRLRSENGREQPWNVKWWSVGNEMYGDWQLGFMPTEDFARKHNEFVVSMKSADTAIQIVAVGNPGEWNEMMLNNCADQMDYISEHFYRQNWHSGGLITHVRQIPDAIRERAELHRQYREEIPGLAGKDIRICMDEWNYWYGPHIFGELGTRYFLKDALGIAAGINEYSRQSDIIYMANYAQTVNVIGCIKTDDIHSSFATTGLVLKLYRNRFGNWPVLLDESYRPLDVAMTLTEARDTLCIGIVNPTTETWKLPLQIDTDNAEESAYCWSISGEDPMLYNVPGEEAAVVIEGPEQVKWRPGLKIAPLSINLIRIPIMKTGS